ncbi:uncharacterized protein EDB91DRAFT_1127659 [Suillus paluster]|uniref:uncharacterized protein n=1 Tax=Suillus paluster TaxID=48578 RepID=UPI001B86911D|nr:uncharacterized protein EDB91DRAFT_1127659 [Suillus paluster]KAG1742715.1 hypothetical protein EDB91DRAFT_1127659 [Suillus paluster]
MAIGKWNPFGQPVVQTTTSDNPVPQPLPIFPRADGKQFGLENFGNTCYANSVLQALYFCSPFRDLVIQHADPYAAALQAALSSQFTPTPTVPTAVPASPTVAARRKQQQPERKSVQDAAQPNGVVNPPTPPIPSSPRTLISALRSLYIHISQNPADKGTVAPRAFIDKLKELNEAFRNTMHQDAHEFLNYLLNRIVEEIEEEKKHPQIPIDDSAHSVKSSSTVSQPLAMTASTSSSGSPSTGTTFIHQIFEGILTSETRCLTCENVSSRDESFLDLSIDIEQNSSVTACLRQFSASEMLCQRNKFFCDGCCDLQEAEKRMKIKRLPNVLALHLKRFKYQEDVQKYIKLAYRVAFPFELRLFNTIDDAENPDRLYELFAIVVHIGSGPNHGHYVSIIKTMGTWLVFDDETVDSIKESDIPKYFGESNAGSAYVLYYQAVDLDLVALDLRPPTPHAAEQHPHQRLPTDSPVSVSQPIPFPPGLSAEPAASGETEPLLPPPSLPTAIPVPPAEKSPRKIPPEFMNPTPPSPLHHPATVGPSSSSKQSSPARHGILRHVPSLRVGADKRDMAAKSITPFPKHESPDPLPPIPASPNGKEKETEKKSTYWFRRKSLKSGAKSRPTLEIATTLPPDVVLDVGASPTRFHTTGLTSKHSKDDGSRHPSEPAVLDRPVAPFMVKRRPASASGFTSSSKSPGSRRDTSPSISATTSYSSHTTSTSASSSPPDHHSHTIRPLPTIPASPQSSRMTPFPLPPPAYPRGHSSEQPRPHRRPTVSPRDFEPPTSPKSPARPTTAGASLGLRSSVALSRDRNLPPLPGAVVDDPPNGTHSTSPMTPPGPDKGKTQAKIKSHEEGAGLSGRPKSAHASTSLGLGAVLQSSTSANASVAKRASRKLSFSAFPFTRKDKQRDKGKEQE